MPGAEQLSFHAVWWSITFAAGGGRRLNLSINKNAAGMKTCRDLFDVET